MGKTFTILMGMLLLLLLSGCGVRQKIAEKVADEITEGVIEKATGGDVDVDLEDGKINIKGEDGAEWTMGGGEWPKDDVATLIPELKKGKIVSVLNTPEGCWIQVEDIDEKIFQGYVEALQNAGFDQEVTTFSDQGNSVFIARLEGKALAEVTYTQNTQTMFIAVSVEN